jgi:hypothetical protein
MNDQQRLQKIQAIEADFNAKLEEHSRRIKQIVQDTLRQIDAIKAEALTKSIKQDY